MLSHYLPAEATIEVDDARSERGDQVEEVLEGIIICCLITERDSAEVSLCSLTAKLLVDHHGIERTLMDFDTSYR